MGINTKISTLASLIGALGTLAAGAAYAQSSVTVYGTIDAYAGSRQLAGGTRASVLNDGGMSTSYFGFKGTEDLGNDLKANFELAGFFGADSGAGGRFANDPLFARQAKVGLSGKFGAIDAGRNSTPYFISMISFNPFGDSSAFSPIFLHTYTGGQFPISAPPLNALDSGMANMIQYTMPATGGFTGSLQYGLGEVAGDTSKNRVSGRLHYNNGPLALAFAIDRSTTSLGALATIPNSENRQASYMGGATYDFGAVKLFAQYEQTVQEFNAANTDRKFKTYQLGASVPMGAGKFLVSWANTKIDLPAAGVSPYTVVPGFPALPAGVATSGVDPKRDTVTFGYDHALSKRTDVYALLMVDKYTGLETGKSMGVGIRHRF